MMAPSKSIDDLCGRISCTLPRPSRSGPTATLGWERYAGLRGTIIGMKTLGASAPLKELLVKFGFTPEHVNAAAKEQLARKE